MWQTIKETIQQDTTKYIIQENGNTLTRKEVINYWKTNQVFRKFYNQILVDAAFAAFYWENPSITESELEEDYEFVLVNSNALLKVNPEPTTFKDYFKDDKGVVVFPNLGKDALLVVPTPLSDSKNYTHLASFVRSAPETQIDAFWKALGGAYEKAISEKRKWLSTAGLGVYWLHIRIDSRPKYYKHSNYK